MSIHVRYESQSIVDHFYRAPTAGGQYHWVAMLAPKSSQKIVSYITAWLTVLGWQVLIAAASLLTGTMIQGVVISTTTTTTQCPKGWHGTLLAWAVVICGISINACVSGLLATKETLILILHGICCHTNPLLYLAPHSSPQQVPGLNDSERTYQTNGVLGLGMLVTMVFCLGDIVKIASTPLTQYPFMAVFAQAAGSSAGGWGLGNGACDPIHIYMCDDDGAGLFVKEDLVVC